METPCALRLWLNGKEILTRSEVSNEPVPLKSRLLLGLGTNHVLIKVVNTDTDFKLKASLSSTHDDFIGKLEASVER